MEDLGIERVTIDPEDYYWDCPPPGLYDPKKKPLLNVGSLSDDAHFVGLIAREASGAAACNLVHAAPLLRYLAEKVKS